MRRKAEMRIIVICASSKEPKAEVPTEYHGEFDKLRTLYYNIFGIFENIFAVLFTEVSEQLCLFCIYCWLCLSSAQRFL